MHTVFVCTKKRPVGRLGMQDKKFKGDLFIDAAAFDVVIEFLQFKQVFLNGFHRRRFGVLNHVVRTAARNIVVGLNVRLAFALVEQRPRMQHLAILRDDDV